MTLVMGHTDEPVRQVIHVVAAQEDKSRATSVPRRPVPRQAVIRPKRAGIFG
jgi:hypothetical protein